MKVLNDKIRNDIANSYYLRSKTKDDKITKEKKDELFRALRANDRKIIFLKGLSAALKKVEKDEENKRVVQR